MSKSKKVKKIKLCFNNFLNQERKKINRNNSKNNESGKLKKVLDIFIKKEKNYINLDDLSGREWSNILIKYKNKLINNSKIKKPKTLKNKIKSRTDVNNAMIVLKEKGDSCKNETAEKIYDKPWVLKLASICIIAFIFSISICRFSPELSSMIINKTDRILYSKISQLHNCSNTSRSNQSRDNEPIDNKEIFAKYIINNNQDLKLYNKNNNTFLITKDELFGQTAKAAGKDTSINTNSNFNIIKNNSNNIFLLLENIYQNISKKQEQISTSLEGKLINILNK
ncbi:hypothetical protein DRH27_01155 [Candidatus Falkowbacteria bacterium]|nr:MAG: hypothetical protein DRH27_01155 [Candidatus Falkowbacteria bacterium]